MDGDLIIRYFLLHCKGFIGDVKLNLTNKPAPSEYDQRETNDSCNYHTRGKTCLDGGQILKGLDCYTEAVCLGSHEALAKYGLIWYHGKYLPKDINHGVFYILSAASRLDPFAITTLQELVELGKPLGNYHDTVFAMLDEIRNAE